MRIDAGPLDATLRETIVRLEGDRVVQRIHSGDHTVWKPDPAEITNRLGWIDIASRMGGAVGELHALADELTADGISDVVLLGMGGSSLGAEVLRTVLGVDDRRPRLHVLDSTVPAWVDRVTRAIDVTRSVFLVASKSGGTTEVMSFLAHFEALARQASGDAAGNHFVAITDPATSLASLAVDRGFRRTFINDPDIGGRYSVLSHFGLVAAAVLGADLEALLESAVAMEDACRADTIADNPGARLGALLGAGARAGRDKLTLITSPTLDAFGWWAEQLIAESTGKEGTGILPIAGEPRVDPKHYRPDRVFAHVHLAGDATSDEVEHVAALRAAGHPVVDLPLATPEALGGAFLQWEFATALAGHVLGIQPFDQPNVQESKDNTKRVLATFESEGALPDVAGSHDSLEALLDAAGDDAYVAILAYTDQRDDVESAVDAFRRRLLESRGLASTFGYGPRYLHSTGQFHKGDRGNGVFVQIRDPGTVDVPVPGQPYSFRTLAEAQAIGDLQALVTHGRAVAVVPLDALR